MGGFTVVDIETVPDRSAIEISECPKYGLSDYNQYIEHLKKESKKNQVFVKPVFHRVICIGMLNISADFRRIKYKDSYGTDEKEVLMKFWKNYGSMKHPCFVTFNGITFDMPVINMRSLKYVFDFPPEVTSQFKDYNVSSDKWENNRPNYNNNYSKYHIDFIRETGSPRASLINLCAIYGIKVKSNYSGNDVETLFSNNDFDSISEYCKEDVFATAEIFARYIERDISAGEELIHSINSLR